MRSDTGRPFAVKIRSPTWRAPQLQRIFIGISESRPLFDSSASSSSSTHDLGVTHVFWSREKILTYSSELLLLLIKRERETDGNGRSGHTALSDRL